MIVTMQSYHALDDSSWAQKRIGAEHRRTTYALCIFLDGGA